MKRKKASILKKLQWRAEFLAFMVVERLLNLVSLETLWNAGAALSGLARLFASRWPTVRNNLRTVLGPEATEEKVAELTREVFRHTTANLLTSLKGAHINARTVRDSIDVRNVEAAERAFAQGKGIIYVSAHMGNWELLAQAMGAFLPDVKIANIYRPLNNIYLDKILRDRRKKRGMKMFAKLTSYYGPLKFVRSQNILGLLVDQRAGRVGTLTPFFGRLMSMSPLPEFFHKHTGAPVLGVSMKTTAPGKWTVTFHEPNLKDGEAFTTPHMAALLEEAIGESLVDEFWMQDLWRINKHRPLEIRGKVGPVRLNRDRDKPLYPFSILVRLPDQPERFAETVPALTALAASRPDMELHFLARDILRKSAAASMIPHSFHAIEDDHLPQAVQGRLQVALVLTDQEIAARELTSHFSGLTYSLPEVEQSNKDWHLVSSDPTLPAEERWLDALRTLGLHEPPLQWVYL